MDIIQKLFSPSNQKKELGLPKGLTWGLFSGMWMPYDEKDTTYINKAYKAIPIIYGIISEIIDRASDAPPQIYRIVDEKAAKSYFNHFKNYNGSKDAKVKLKALRVKAFEELENFDLLDVFVNPNPTMTGKELRESSMGYLLLTGNSIEYNASPSIGIRAGNIREIWSIPSPCVQLEFNSNLRDPLTGYTISYYQETIPKEKITHVKYFNPIASTQDFREMFWGLSPLRSATRLISQKNNADIAQGSLFKNMAPAGLIVGNNTQGVEQATPEQAVAINDHFRQNHMGVYNAGDILVTPANVRWEAIGLSPVDLQIIDWDKRLDEQIANIYHYPKEFLEKGGVVSNSESAAERFARNCILPLIRRYDDARTKKLREWYKDDSLVYMSDTSFFPELQPDKEQLSKWMRSVGVFTQQEIREALDYDSEFDPTQVLVPSSMTPLSDVMSGDLPIEDQTNEI